MNCPPHAGGFLWATLSFIHLPSFTSILQPHLPRAGATSHPACLELVIPLPRELSPGNHEGCTAEMAVSWRSKPRSCFHPPAKGEGEQEEPSLSGLPLDNVLLLG